MVVRWAFRAYAISLRLTQPRVNLFKPALSHSPSVAVAFYSCSTLLSRNAFPYAPVHPGE